MDARRPPDDEAWAAQLGPALTEPDVARMLGTTVAAIRSDTGLLRVTNRDGMIVYPVCQFEARRPLAGLSDVIRALSGVWQPLTLVSWMTAPNRQLGWRTPVQALHDGDPEAVHELARRVGASAHGI
jgi:hypothetical protein